MIGKVFDSVTVLPARPAVVAQSSEVNLISTPPHQPPQRSPVTTSAPPTAAPSPIPSGQVPASKQDSPVKVTSPVPSEQRSRLCSNCGDVMTSAFHCNSCRAYTYREVKCPACGNINRDLKNYSCRYCYVNLLIHLTSKEKKAAEDASRKTLKQSKSNVAELTKVEVKAEKVRSKSASASLIVNESGQHIVTPVTTPISPKRSTTPHLSSPPGNLKACPSSSSSPIVVQSSSDERSKVDILGRTSDSDDSSSESKSPVVLKIKKRPQRAILSDSSSDEDIAPSNAVKIMKRKASVDPFEGSDGKRRHPDTNPSRTSRPGNGFRAMSKKQRDILARMKNMNRSANVNNNSRILTSPIWNRRAEWEVTQHRKPGPRSRTTYYKIHRAWNIDLSKIKLPDDFRGMDSFCRVSLSPYPEDRMEGIFILQPTLIQEFSDKILFG